MFTWLQGRNLTSAAVDGTTYFCSYNDNGIRTQKKISTTVTTQYYLSGDTVVAQKTGEKLLVHLLDENGVYYGFLYDGTKHYYRKNLQGDAKYFYGM